MNENLKIKQWNKIQKNICKKKVNLPIQSGSNDPARDSEYLLPANQRRNELLLPICCWW